MRRVAVLCLAIGPVACLASPPPPAGEGPDAAPVFSACGNAQIDVAYMSRFTIDPDSYGRVGLDRIGLLINSGAGLLDLSSLEVVGASVDDDYSTLTFEAYDNQGPPVEPGEARGELRSSGRDMVLAQLEEDWTDPYSPEISGMLITARSQGEIRGTVEIALGPHRVTLDLEFDLATFRGSGAYARAADRRSSTCAEGA